MLKITEAAAYLNVHANTLRKFIKDGTLPAVHLGPKTVRIRVSDLDRLGKKND